VRCLLDNFNIFVHKVYITLQLRNETVKNYKAVLHRSNFIFGISELAWSRELVFPIGDHVRRRAVASIAENHPSPRTVAYPSEF
jgi:hypothetical protein